MKTAESICDRERMDFKINSNVLTDADITHFNVYKKKPHQTHKEFIKEISNLFGVNMGNYYFCDEDYVDNYLFVQVWSGRTSAIYTSNMISNRSKHKLKHMELLHDKWIIMAFKDASKCNNWE